MGWALLGAVVIAAAEPSPSLSPHYTSSRGAECAVSSGHPVHISGHDALVDSILRTAGNVTPGDGPLWPVSPRYGVPLSSPPTGPLRTHLAWAWEADTRFGCFQRAPVAGSPHPTGSTLSQQRRRGRELQDSRQSLYAEMLSEGYSEECTEDTVLDQPKVQKIKDVVRAAVTQFASAVRPRHACGDDKVCPRPLLPSGDTLHCWGANIDSALGKAEKEGGSRPAGGYDTELVVVVVARPSLWLYQDRATLAWAVPCRVDETGRPTVVVLNIDPSIATGTQYAERVVLQELLAAAALSSLLQPFWIRWDAAGQVYRRRGAVTRQYTERGALVRRFVTPNAAKAVREHFDCDAGTLPGPETENYLREGRTATHLEKRVHVDSVLSVPLAPGAALDSVVLGLLQDTGWYHTDPAAAQQAEWGEGQGCNFAMAKCSSWSESHSCHGLVEEYIAAGHPISATQRVEERRCAADGGAGMVGCSAAYVPWERWASVPPVNQYFSSDNQVAGCMPWADYCALWSPVAGMECTDPRGLNSNGEDCTATGSQCDPLSVPGANSRCFMGTLRLSRSSSVSYSPLKGSVVDDNTPQCLPYACVTDPRLNRWVLSIRTGAGEFNCTEEGAEVGPGAKGVEGWGF
eukprot:Hpha_TRINITY_DN22316_c0_g1::TRINITY_DN22316_c0_g1_i1::g.177732::m.177732